MIKFYGMFVSQEVLRISLAYMNLLAQDVGGNEIERMEMAGHSR